MGSSGSRRLEKADLNYLLSKTRYNKAELEAWHEAFHLEYPRGYMSVRDYSETYRRRFPDGDPSDLAKHMFRVFDADTDGKMNFREFMINLNVIHRGTTEEKLALAFKLYDVDGDKKITRSEMKEINRAMLDLIGPITSAAEDELDASIRTKRVFRQMDKSYKGFLLFEDFAEGVKNDLVIARLLFDGKQNVLGVRR